MLPKPNPRFPRIITEYLRIRLAPLFPPREVARIDDYLQACFKHGVTPLRAGQGWSWVGIGRECGIEPDTLKAQRRAVEPILLALLREIERAPDRSSPTAKRRRPAGVGEQPGPRNG